MLPHPSPSPDPRLSALKERITAIERSSHAARNPRSASTWVAAASEPDTPRPWTLGVRQFDALLSEGGLDQAAVHEIKPSAEAGWAAATGCAHRFALALAVRRLATLSGAQPSAPILLCTDVRHAAEAGTPYGPGLAALGIDPGRLLIVEAAKPADVLWAVEEGLKSHALALVLALLDDIELSPARRLALAAAGTRTPCLMLTHPRSPPAAATATRWRIGPTPSAPHEHDRAAPGVPRFRVELERCRDSPAALPAKPHVLEWYDAASRFRMAAGLADRSSRTSAASGRPRTAMAG